MLWTLVWACHVLVIITRSTRFALESVQDEAVPGGTEHSTQLGDGKGIDVLAHCRETQTISVAGSFLKLLKECENTENKCRLTGGGDVCSVCVYPVRALQLSAPAAWRRGCR